MRRCLLAAVVMALFAALPAHAGAVPHVYRGTGGDDRSAAVMFTVDGTTVTNFQFDMPLKCPDGTTLHEVASPDGDPGYLPTNVSDGQFQILRVSPPSDPKVFTVRINGTLGSSDAHGTAEFAKGDCRAAYSWQATEEAVPGLDTNPAPPRTPARPAVSSGTLHPANRHREYFIVVTGLACRPPATHVLFTVAHHRARIACGRRGIIAVSRRLQPGRTYKVRVQAVRIRSRHGRKLIVKRGAVQTLPIEVFPPGDPRWQPVAGLPRPL